MATQTNQTLDSDVDVLRKVPFFAGFSDEHLKLIAFSAESRSLPDKLLLFDEGQLLHSAYVIVSGTLKGEHKVKGTDKVVRRDIGPGVILGERALILDSRAMESVRVETRTRVLQVRKLMFRKLLQDYPEIARILRSRLARHVLHVASEFETIGERLKAIDASLPA
jgi:CRP-like cAMP-binding protein